MWMPVAHEMTGIDAPTMDVEDSYVARKAAVSPLDFRRMIGIVGALYWIVMTLLIVPFCVAANYIFVLFPILLFSVRWYNYVERICCQMVNDHWVSASICTGFNIVEYGDDISQIAEERVLLLPNHLGLADHFCIMTALYEKGCAGRYLWLVFNGWKATPLGIMWYVHGNFFIDGGKGRREKQLAELKEHLIKYYWKHNFGWIIIYPEGSRLFMIKESSKNYALKHGHKVFKHCALPRIGAVQTILDVAGKDTNDVAMARCGLGGPIKYIVDCTLGYYKGEVGDLGQYLLGDFPNGVSTVGVHFKIFPVKPEFSDERILQEWLYKRFEEKDKLLDHFYEKGTFPSDGKTHPRQVVFPFSRFAKVQCFWIILFSLHYVFWLKPVMILLRSFLPTLF